MARVLVTGTCGMIGRYASRVAAEAGHHVVGLGHGSPLEAGHPSPALHEWYELDVTLSALLDHGPAPDVLIHCAGSGSVAFSLSHPAQDYTRTVGTTLEVLEYVRTCAPHCRVVYPSSAAVYGQAFSLPIMESAPTSPISPYGVDKLIAEQLIQSYGRSFGVASTIVRIFSAYGPGATKQLFWDACEKVSRGELTFAGSGAETRDWVHLEDVAHLLLRASEFCDPMVPIAHACSGIETANADLLSELVAAFDDALAPEFTGAHRPGDPTRYVGASSVADGWGWRPARRLTEGIREYVAWYQGTPR